MSGKVLMDTLGSAWSAEALGIRVTAGAPLADRTLRQALTRARNAGLVGGLVCGEVVSSGLRKEVEWACSAVALRIASCFYATVDANLAEVWAG